MRTARAALSEPGTEQPGHHRRNGLVFVALGVAVVLIGVGAVGWAATAAAPAHTVRDLAGNQVAIEPDVLPAPATVKRMEVSAPAGDRFSVPAVGLDVPLAAMNEVDHTITPPGFQDAYRVRNIGTTPSNPGAGTVFVVMHSIRGGGVGPGNYLFDLARGASRVPVGSPIAVAGVQYRVTESHIVTKTGLPAFAGIWANTPGRLVVITCLQRPDGRPSTDNLVITAELVR